MYKSLEEFNAGLDWGMQAGYTTGSCACAAAKAALYAALGREIDLVRVFTPAGVFLDLEVREREISEEIWEGHTLQALRLGIQKYAGDDPDVTDGIDIYAKLLLLEKDLLLRCKDRDSRLLEAALDRNLRAEEENAVWICGGEGVGKVEKKGLDRKIGEAAINSVPRQMIRTHLREVLQEAGSSLDVLVEISVPLGRELAKKTFNPKLGIMGGDFHSGDKRSGAAHEQAGADRYPALGYAGKGGTKSVYRGSPRKLRHGLCRRHLRI